LFNLFSPKNKKTKYATIPKAGSLSEGVQGHKPDIPDGLMTKCRQCGTIQFTKELDKNLKVCLVCGYHFRLSARERIAYTCDENAPFEEFDANLVSEDPLEFPGYAKKIAQQREKTGLNDAVVTGQGYIDGYPVILAVMTFDFFAGSMGSVVGEKITRAIEIAHARKLPLLIFSTSSGARMQESILSLMQMAKTSAALARFQEDGGLYISILTDPTTGGVSASFAMLGDINLAEPGALVGFAGRVVIEQTIRQKLPDDFQTAEFNLQHGQLDKVVARKDMKSLLGTLLEMHGSQKEGAHVDGDRSSI
jgi:acetyl-CoA carboxylase carboxyl transferase subunit beta